LTHLNRRLFRRRCLIVRCTCGGEFPNSQPWHMSAQRLLCSWIRWHAQV
jgi:hypothetical protein